MSESQKLNRIITILSVVVIVMAIVLIVLSTGGCAPPEGGSIIVDALQDKPNRFVDNVNGTTVACYWNTVGFDCVVVP